MPPQHPNVAAVSLDPPCPQSRSPGEAPCSVTLNVADEKGVQFILRVVAINVWTFVFQLIVSPDTSLTSIDTAVCSEVLSTAAW